MNMEYRIYRRLAYSGTPFFVDKQSVFISISQYVFYVFMSKNICLYVDKQSVFISTPQYVFYVFMSKNICLYVPKYVFLSE